MFPWKSVSKGFLLAPLPVWGLLSIPGFFDDLSIDHWTWREALGHELFVFPYYVLGSYLISFMIALPLYALGWRYMRVSFLSCIFCGALVGGALLWVPFLLQLLGTGPMFESESLGGVPLVVAHKFTKAGLIHYFLSGFDTALFGATIAFVFWFLAVRKCPAAQSKEFAGTETKEALP